MPLAEKQHPWGAIFAMATLVPIVVAGLYSLARWLTEDRDDVSLMYDWEQHIPIVPAFIGPYLTLYPLIVLGIAISRSRRDLWRLVGAMIAATLICTTIFVVFPTSVEREGMDVVQGNTRDIYELVSGLGGANCAAPSLHVVLAGILWVHFAAALRGRWRWLVHAWFSLLILSTLLTYQHHVLDVISGAALAAISVILWGVGRSEGSDESDQVLPPLPLAHKQQERTRAEQP